MNEETFVFVVIKQFKTNSLKLITEGSKSCKSRRPCNRWNKEYQTSQTTNISEKQCLPQLPPI